MDDKQLEQEFMLFLGELLQAKNQKDLELKVQKLGQEGLKKYYQAFVDYKKKKALKAAHGAKLNYFRKLKNQCAEDEELHYFKRGGQVDCGCVKKAQQGTKTQEPKKKTPQQEFKEKWTKKDEEKLDSLSRQKKLTPQGQKDKITLLLKFKRAPNRKDYELEEGKKGMKVLKTCGGGFLKSKIKVSAKGSKVCPKCGKVHTGSCK